LASSSLYNCGQADAVQKTSHLAFKFDHLTKLIALKELKGAMRKVVLCIGNCEVNVRSAKTNTVKLANDELMKKQDEVP
jgi:hypothetical protein